MGSFGELNEYGHAMKSQFLFDPKYTNLNHGSFGSYPLPVRNALRGYQKLSEAAPDKFLRYQYIDLLDKARDRVAALVNAPVDECVFVQNTTLGVNTILRNLVYKEKDVIIYFDTVYGGIEKTLASIVETDPHVSLRKVGAGQDFGYTLPCTHPDILNAFSQTISRIIYDGYTPRVAVFETIVSIPGVRFPFERLTRMCKEYGILSVVDGAHGVGQIDLNLSQLDADFFVSNCHKWLYTPRGCALLHVPKRNQHLIRTTYPTSHGYVPLPGSSSSIRNPLPPTTKSDFINLFQFVATADNSPYYCVPAAINFRNNLCKGGENGIYEYIRDLAQRGADLLALLLGTEVMDDRDEGRGLKTMGSLEATDRREGGNWTGGLRDCAMANVLLPIHITGANTVTSITAGPGGAGSAGGLSPLHGQGRKGSYGFPSSNYSPVRDLAPTPALPTGLEPPGAPWMKGEVINSSPQASPSLNPGASGPIIIRKDDVPTHIAWMEKTLVDEFNTFVAIYEYNGKMWARICGQIYLELKDFEWLGGVLKSLCERVRAAESLRSQSEQEGERLSRAKTRGGNGIGLDLEGLGRSVSEVRLGEPVASDGGSRRFDVTTGSWVQV